MKSLIITIGFLLSTFIGYSQSNDYSKLDSYFSTLEENNRFFGSLAISQAGKIIYTNAIGYADLENELPNNKDTKFRIGSISKTFTATLIMQAVENGKIDLDDSIDQYFPKLQNADKITIRQLLNHRSGIKNFTDRSFFSWYTEPTTKTALLDTIMMKGIDFEPNTEFSYSNSNYVLLTFILEKTYNKPYEQLLEKNITKPLNLSNTYYGQKTDPSKNEARSYIMRSDWEIEPEGHMSIPLGAGGIVSTPTDLCLFAKALFGGKLISAKSLEQMKPVAGENYGFALYSNPIDELEGLGHGGNIDAFNSDFTYLAKEDIVIAISCNGANHGSKDIMIAAAKEILSKPYDLPNFDFIELSSVELDQYLGVYGTDELPIDLTISKEGTQLYGQGTGQSSFKLMAEGNHKFSCSSIGLKITFNPEEKSLQFEQGNAAFECTLIEEEITSTNEIISEKEDSLIEIDLNQYLGTYESSELPMDLVITQEDDKLIGQGTGQPSFPLAHEGDHSFSNKSIGLIITFDPANNTLNFSQGGAKLEMTLKQVATEQEVQNSNQELDSYLGTYTSDELPIDLTIKKDGNKLIGQGTGQASFPLTPEGENTFSNKEIGLIITFYPTENKMNFVQGTAEFSMIKNK